MKQTYKQFTIRSGAAPVRDKKWKPLAQINWSENGHDRVKLWMQWFFDHTFATSREAELEGNLFARNWIDENTRCIEEGRRNKNISKPRRTLSHRGYGEENPGVSINRLKKSPVNQQQTQRRGHGNHPEHR